MSPGFRITDATLDVLQVLVHEGGDLYGLKIAKAAERPTGSVFPILAKLEDCGWVTSEWETSDPAARGPRRRFYQLSPDGLVEARQLLIQRRGGTARSRPQLSPVPRTRWEGGR
jgi:PadR family transcriptional regulator, regulatory protein PadR